MTENSLVINLNSDRAQPSDYWLQYLLSSVVS